MSCQPVLLDEYRLKQSQQGKTVRCSRDYVALHCCWWAAQEAWLLQDWLADGGGWEEGGDNVKYSFFSMTKALQALHSQGLVHR